MARSLTSSLTALNAPAKQAQMTRMSSSEEASWLTPPWAACPAAVGRAEGCALALPEEGALAWLEAGPLAWPEADGLAWGAADARPTCRAATACGDGCDFFVWLAEG